MPICTAAAPSSIAAATPAESAMPPAAITGIFTDLTICLEVSALKALSGIIAQLRAKSVVARVGRVNG